MYTIKIYVIDRMTVYRIKSLNSSIPSRHRYNVNTTSRIAYIKKNHHQRSSTIRVKSFDNDVVSTSYFIGKGIIAFTFFYTSLNYFFYKGLREEYEEDKKDDETKN